jgi:hypothetical protein
MTGGRESLLFWIELDFSNPRPTRINLAVLRLWLWKAQPLSCEGFTISSAVCTRQRDAEQLKTGNAE